MSKPVRHFSGLLCVIFLLGCNFNSEVKEASAKFDLNRLCGRWEFVNDQTNQIEEWSINGENELKGRGFVLSNTDTTFIEFLSIKQKNGVLTYFAQVSDAGSPEIVPFSLTFQSGNMLEFTNMSNDFPKKIVYTMKNDSTMQAYIEGPRDGSDFRVIFDFKKRLKE